MPWDPTNTAAFLAVATDSPTTHVFKSTYTNLDTALGMSLFHNNRCVGKAVYGFNLETLNNDFSVISGYNTT